ncbi:hypothetical protein GQ44DRAFT_679203 [Phaeosphaeriaceae sp. PMI808]|nr:hypothetical protein GQ44DRAFT_679203 [Phaeosphaeriaceae sp. PMI808]
MWEPFGTAPANGTAFWKSGPNERGTLNILTICIITLLLCAYTSLHLDIPKHGKAGWTHQGWRRFLWVVAGLSAPEFVAFIACQQWLFARKLEDQMQDILGQLLPSSKATPSQDDLEDIPLIRATTNGAKSNAEDRQYPWTRVHSHFALMGGYVFQQGEKRETLTAPAIRKIARNSPRLLPDISKGFIRDKSKANSLAKFLVCVQTIWFIAQTIGRLATGLPISLLELNTLCHGFCCLFIYMAWWHKPLDIEEPYLINASDGHASKVLAWMIEKDLINSSKGLETISLEGATTNPKDPSPNLPNYSLVYQDDITTGPDDDSIKSQTNAKVSIAKEYNKRHNRVAEISAPDYNSQWSTIDEIPHVKLHPGQKIHGFVLYLDVQDTSNHPTRQDIHLALHPDRVTRLRQIQSLRRSEGATHMWTFGIKRHGNEAVMLNESSIFVSSDDTLKKWRRSKFVSPNAVLYTGLLVAGSLYGAVHLFAWNGPFPTKVQRMLWRVSCIVISSPLVLIVLFYVVVWVLYFWWGIMGALGEAIGVIRWMVRFIRWLKKSEFVEGLAGLLFLLVVGLLGLVYVSARLYLVVECFMNVAHLPEGVFQEPSWSQYIPHFGAG